MADYSCYANLVFTLLQAGAVGVFSGIPDPIFQSGMSRIVGDDEQGNTDWEMLPYLATSCYLVMTFHFQKNLMLCFHGNSV